VGAQREQQLGGGAGGAPASSGERDRRGRGEELQRAESKWVWGVVEGRCGSSGGSALRGERRPWRAAVQLSAVRARPAACERVASGMERHTASSARGCGDHDGRWRKVRAGEWQVARVRERGERVSEKDTPLWTLNGKATASRDARPTRGTQAVSWPTWPWQHAQEENIGDVTILPP